MKLIIYGDFNCPHSYLASQRAATLAGQDVAEIDWRAVEHEPGLPLTGTPSGDGEQAWKARLAEVAALALPGEQPPAAPPAMVSNTRASIAAYAESVDDGIQEEVRRRLFQAIWADGRHISSAYEVRRVIEGLTWTPGDPSHRLYSPDFPGSLDHDPDPRRIVRRAGGTVAPDGGPLSSAGYRRIQQWRREWLGLPEQVTPTVVGPEGPVTAGGGLAYLAGLARASSAG